MKQQIVKPLCAFVLFASTICCVSSRAATEESTPKTTPTTKAKADDTNIEYSKIVEGYSLEASAKEKYASSETIIVSTTLKNLGDDSHIIDQSNEGVFDYDFSVTLPNGKPAPKTLYGQYAFDIMNSFFSRQFHASFKAGSEIRKEFHLNRYFDMTLPGTYIVSFSRNVYKRQGPNITFSKVNGVTMMKLITVKVFSNVVKLTIQ